MAEKYLFFNSTQGDMREYQANDIADYWNSFLSTGLISDNGEPQLKVVAEGTNRIIEIQKGRALIDGHLYLNDSTKLKIEEPDTLYDRIDRVVIRYDNTIKNRFIKAFVLKGETSENPVPPQLTREGDIYELSLAQIRVVGGKSFIEQKDIVDERLKEDVCGLASSLVSVPTSIFDESFKEYMDKIAMEWQDWYNSIESDTYVTNAQFDAHNRQVDRQLANLNAIADIDERAIGNTKKFYDLFDGTNDKSVAKLDKTIQKTLTSKALGENQLILVEEPEFRVGDEVEIYYTTAEENLMLHAVTDKILAINGKMLTVQNTLQMNAGASIQRYTTSKVSVESWANPKVLQSTLDTSKGYRFVGHPIRNILIEEMNAASGRLLFIDADNNGNINIKATLSGFFYASLSQDGRYIFYKASASSTDYTLCVGKIDYETMTITKIFANVLATSATNYYVRGAIGQSYRIGEYDYIMLDDADNNFVPLYKYKWSDNTLVETFRFPNNANINTWCWDMHYDQVNNRLYCITTSNDVLYTSYFDMVTKKVSSLTTLSGLPNVGYTTQNTSFESGLVKANCNERNYTIFIPRTANSSNYKTPLVIYRDKDGVYKWKLWEGFTYIANVPLQPQSTADGRYVASEDKLFFIDDNLDNQLVVDFSAQRVASSISNCTALVNNKIILMPRTTTSYPWKIALPITDFATNQKTLRYKFSNPVKNLAGWLFAKETPTAVKAELSLVDQDENENFKELTVTQKENEYEFLETENLYPKDKATLKLTIEGGSLDKLLGGIE